MKNAMLLTALLWTLLTAMTPAPGHDVDVALLGDSNTNIGGDDCSRPVAWSKWFVDSFAPRSCRSFARSGATWTNTPRTQLNTDEYIEIIGDNNVIYNQTRRLIDAVDAGTAPRPDIIIIGAGTNDAWFLRLRPGALSRRVADVDTAALMSREISSLTSLAESVIYNCQLLRKHFPAARIILLTPHQTIKAPLGRITAVSDIITDAGIQLGLDVIRQDRESGIVAANEKRKFVMTSDGTHTSEDGARHVGRLIADRVARLIETTP